VALIPMFKIYNSVGIFDTVLSLVLFHTAFGLPFAIFSQMRQFGSNIEIIAPASFVALGVPLAVFFPFQRYFVEGLLAGSVK
jgi:alpha-glucoside transport system permease protein